MAYGSLGPGTSLHSQGPGCEKVKVAQSRPTLCDPMDCSLPASSVHGILQARILAWVAALFSVGDLPNGGYEPRPLALQVDSLSSKPPGRPIINVVEHKI